MDEDAWFDLFHIVGAIFAAQFTAWLIWNDPTPEAICAGVICVPLELLVVGSVLANQNLGWWKRQLIAEARTIFTYKAK